MKRLKHLIHTIRCMLSLFSRLKKNNFHQKDQQRTARFFKKDFLTALKLCSSRSSLPWYIAIGADHHDIKTLLTTCGFSHQAFTTQTDCCRWSFNQQALILEPHDFNTYLWQTLLALLRIYRHQPLEGILLILHAHHLSNHPLPEVEISESLTLLKQALPNTPIYMVMTGIDSMVGFHEFFTSIDTQTRQNPWYIDLRTPQKLSIEDRWIMRFRPFIAQLNRQVIPKMHQEYQLETRTQIQTFPAHFELWEPFMVQRICQWEPSVIYFASCPQPGERYTSMTLMPSWCSVDTQTDQHVVSSNFNTTTRLPHRPCFITQLFTHLKEQTQHQRQDVSPRHRSTTHTMRMLYTLLSVLLLLMILSYFLLLAPHIHHWNPKNPSPVTSTHDHTHLSDEVRLRNILKQSLQPHSSVSIATTYQAFKTYRKLSRKSHHLTDLLSPDDHQALKILLQQAVSTGELFSQMLRTLSTDSTSTNPLAVPSIYTYAQRPIIYQNTLKQLIDTWYKEEHFYHILDMDQMPSQAQLLEYARSHYLQDYAQAWETALERWFNHPIHTLSEASARWSQLSNPNSPFFQFLQQMTAHSTADKTFKSYNRVINSSLQPYRLALMLLKKQDIKNKIYKINQLFKQIILYNNPEKAAFNVSVAHMQASSSTQDIFNDLYTSNIPSSQPLQTGLYRLTQNSSHILLKAAAHYINNRWQKTLWPIYQEHFAGRYPFSDVKQIVVLEDFYEFFRPEGQLSHFVNYAIKPFVVWDHEGHPHWKNRYQERLPLSDAALHLLTYLQHIQQLLFDHHQLSLSFHLRPQALNTNLQKLKMQFNQKTTTLVHDEKPLGLSLAWPFISHITWTVTNLQGQIYTRDMKGPWALLQWLREGKWLHMNNSSPYQYRFIALTAQKQPLAQYEITSNRNLSDLANGLLEHFQCSDNLLER